MPRWLTFLLDVLPVFGDWLKQVLTTSDDEFQRIVDTWPEPTRMKLARLRAEQHARDHFGVDEV